MKKNPFKSSLFFKILFVLSISILLFVGALNYNHNKNISNSTERVVHTYKVNLELEKIISYLKDGQTGVRGYLVTRDTVFLNPYLLSRKKVDDSFKSLKSLTNDNQEQQQNLSSLWVLIEKKYENFEQTINRNKGTEIRSGKIFETNFILDKVVMDAISKQITEMVTLEESYLKIRNKNYDNQIDLSPVLAIGALFVTLLLLVLSYIKINNDVQNLQESNDNLLFSKTSNDQSEILGNYSSWLWNLDTNEMVFSDNQYRLLGVAPQSFEASNENFLKYVHPDDVKIVEEIIEHIIANETLPTVFYRMIRTDKKTRYYKSSGTLIYNRFKNRVILGNTRDVTDERDAKLNIELKNLELEQSNNELISFNYVASHDLQEPLRKIQTFISRFSDSDKNSLSENGKGYFSKIEASVTKMRGLIDDLLLYSRTSKAEKIFEKFSLNDILDNSKQELSQIINDSDVIINSENLPTLEIIPFQMQQLFVNLIGNSIKYAKKDIPVIINISSEKIQSSDDAMLSNSTVNHYYKISFSDNGIGFEQQYAEQIFVLFSRLIDSDKYLGTGIGLTICKKIAENHSGYLSAQGEIGVGATFNLFLPIIS